MARTVLILESDDNFASSLITFFQSVHYDVVTHANTVGESIKLIESHKPDIITSSLKLNDGSGLSVFEFLRHDFKRLQFKPLCIVISSSIDSQIRTYIHRQLQPTGIEIVYFKKNDTFTDDDLKSLIKIKENYFTKTVNSEIVSATMSKMIQEKLVSYGISNKYRGFDYLVYIVEYILSEELNVFLIEDLYDIVSSELSVDVSTIKKGITKVLMYADSTNKNSSFPTSPKRFISMIVDELK